LSLVHINLVVIAKRQLREIAVEVKNDISVNIDEEVTLTLLGVNKAVNLKTLIQVVRLAAFKGLLVFRAGESGLYLRLLVLIGILEAKEL
jgi:hypothetical protein